MNSRKKGGGRSEVWSNNKNKALAGVVLMKMDSGVDSGWDVLNTPILQSRAAELHRAVRMRTYRTVPVPST
jgi:hypothetical protein